MITVDGNAPTWFQRVLTQINRALAAIRPDNAVAITGGTISNVTISSSQIGLLSSVQVGQLTVTQLATLPGGASLLTTTAALTTFSSTGVGTLTNSPIAGNPSKWVAVNDAGTTRYVPMW